MNQRLILFQGDSLTDAGRSRSTMDKNISLGNGYVTMIAGELGFRYPQIDVLNRGVAGDRIADTYGRWQEDTLNVHYDMLSFMSGINDVGFAIRLGRGSDAGRFEFIYDRMIYEGAESHPDAKIVLCQPFVLKKDLTGTGYATQWENDIYRNYDLWSGEMRRRGDIVQKIAEKYHAIYVPFWDALSKAQTRMGVERLTVDCIHMTAVGDHILAKTWLDTVGPYIGENWL